MSLCDAFVFSYSLVHTSFETIDILPREALTVIFFNRSEVVNSLVLVCLAVRSALFGFQGRNFVHEDRKALVPDVIMLIVVVEIIIIEHGLIYQRICRG